MEVEGRYSSHRHGRDSRRTARRVEKGQMNAMYSGEGKCCWEHFPCPFCDIYIELPFLSKHLEGEHCFSLKTTVCPICADFPEKDMLNHFRVQHSDMLKRTHTTQPMNPEAHEKVPDDSLGRLSLDPSPDPLLSQFVCNFTLPDNLSRGVIQEFDNTFASAHEAKLDSCTSSRSTEQDLTERLKRSEFLSEVLLSTIF